MTGVDAVPAASLSFGTRPVWRLCSGGFIGRLAMALLTGGFGSTGGGGQRESFEIQFVEEKSDGALP